MGFDIACQQDIAESRMRAPLGALESTTVPGGLSGDAQ
jgi:hypothetical protein